MADLHDCFIEDFVEKDIVYQSKTSFSSIARQTFKDFAFRRSAQCIVSAVLKVIIVDA